MNLKIICDVCSEANDPSNAFCICGNPIGHIAATNIDDQSADHVGAPTPSSNPKKYCKTCDITCDTFRLTCDTCNNRFTILEGTPPGASSPVLDSGIVGQSSTAKAKLLMRIQKNTYELQHGNVLGREGDAACASFAPIKEVSRRHALIQNVDGKWLITALSENITEVDGSLVKKGYSHELTKTHRVRLSTKCEITLETVY
jgi:hypothetical protein